ncbi:unnamed protein product [Urochloa humidicola]
MEAQEEQHHWMNSTQALLIRTCSPGNHDLGRNEEHQAHPHRNAAWSAPIPASWVFSRLKSAVGAPAGPGAEDGPSMEEVHRALCRLELAAHQGASAQEDELPGNLDDGPQGMMVDEPELPHEDNYTRQQEDPHAALLPKQPQIADLFTAPDAPVLQQQPQRRQRAKRTFDMTKVLQQYVNAVGGPLPEYVIAALTAFLDLEDDVATEMTEALIQQAGDGVDDLQYELEGAPPAIGV